MSNLTGAMSSIKLILSTVYSGWRYNQNGKLSAIQQPITAMMGSRFIGTAHDRPFFKIATRFTD
jgi:hypothetical protein